LIRIKATSPGWPQGCSEQSRQAAEAIDVARAARRRARENFALSAAYNLIAAPAAFFWTFRAGQYEDPDGAAARVLDDHLSEGPDQ
jgi:nitrogen fixation-related uncharacterized protein